MAWMGSSSGTDRGHSTAEIDCKPLTKSLVIKKPLRHFYLAVDFPVHGSASEAEVSVSPKFRPLGGGEMIFIKLTHYSFACLLDIPASGKKFCFCS